MNRLTKKDLKTGIVSVYSTSGANVLQIADLVEGHRFIGSSIQKLGQLEDIEEELGIDLITLFKTLKDSLRVVGSCHFSDYKNLALTKEELAHTPSQQELEDFWKEI